MRALELHGTGFDQFRLGQRDVPRPAAGQVLLKMHAAAVGLRDYKVVSGAYPSAEQARPLIPGGEGVGEVVELGAGVDAAWLGERVNPVFIQQWLTGRPHPEVIARSALGGPLLDGCFADYMVVPAHSLVKVPAHLSDAEAATLPFAGLTAWSAVAEQGRVRAGDVVLIQGTGGIPLYALQFCKLFGATVIVTSKNDEKLERARALGADHVINYARVPEWSGPVLEITGGLGADLVLDPGGTVTMAQSMRAVRPGGTVSVFNALGSAELGVLLPYLLGHGIHVCGAHPGSRTSHEAMAQAVERGRLQPILESVLPIEEGVQAVERMPKSEQFGKVCLHF
jgi:NADPH:quinone reductase-like Zn-dependent oxidoreductase